MKRWWILIFLTSFYASVVTEDEYEERGGIYTEPQESFTHAARIFDKLTFVCSAVIIGPRLVMTAAHCVDSYFLLSKSTANFSDLSIVTGMSNADTVAVEVEQIKILQEYFPREMQPALADIALLKSKSPLYIGAIKPLFWPIKDFFIEQIGVTSPPDCVLYSWGAVSVDGQTFPERTKKILMHRVSHCSDVVDYCEECDVVNPQEEDMICASVERTRGFTCNGDSGGPLIHHHKKRMTLVGILIGATVEEQSCGKEQYAIDSFVNVFHWKREIAELAKEFGEEAEIKSVSGDSSVTHSRDFHMYGLVYLIVAAVGFTIILAFLVVLCVVYKKARSYGKLIFRKILGIGKSSRTRHESFRT